ncbi:THO complex subunit 6 homolog [Macrobrachium rosenbergii]|uniref:THO complex subunit 6 homolog n=1 Tax=Macrobrachium rosenbergii TaxID=79674 RepID=UPI0034D649E3
MVQQQTLKHLYQTIYSQAVSAECGLLSIGNSDGKLYIFDLKSGSASRESAVGDHLRSPSHVLNAHTDSIYSMISADTFCVTGTNGTITGRRWNDLRQQQSSIAWTISLDCDQANFGTPEVNALAYDNERRVIYAACGDWRTHVYDLETGKRLQTLDGHDDYVHDVALGQSGKLIASSAEDGGVFIWDPRSGREPRHKIFPHSHEQLARPTFGRFITSVDVDNDWLVCGGGPRAGVFHLRSLALTTVLPPSKIVHVAKFTRYAEGGDRGGIVVAGVMPHIYVCSLAGQVTAQLPCSSPCIYTVHVTRKPYTVMTYGGMSSKLDVCYNLNYRDHVVSLHEE